MRERGVGARAHVAAQAHGDCPILGAGSCELEVDVRNAFGQAGEHGAHAEAAEHVGAKHARKPRFPLAATRVVAVIVGVISVDEDVAHRTALGVDHASFDHEWGAGLAFRRERDLPARRASRGGSGDCC